ncbi:MAG: 50S ribosomal protein L11 methyltransferase [Campylobacterales bacterium]|nr:50S ribosomal protein L11 methyltransferase [Campylobacterales bacterium]
MQDSYNQLKITPSCHKDDFVDLLFVLGVEAVEYENETIIVRTKEPVEMLVYGINSFASSLEEATGKIVTVSIVHSVELDKDWIESYRKSIKPIEVEKFYIYPSWESPKEGKINISIDPALAFGSGHHESTYGCLLALQKYVKEDATMLDVGCGSGILAIAATKLGALSSICDTDEIAIKSANKNAKLNEVTFKKQWIGSVNSKDEKYDLVVANIVADVLMGLSKDLKETLKSNGVLILSGILEKYSQNIKEKFAPLALMEEIKDNQWCTMIFKKGD